MNAAAAIIARRTLLLDGEPSVEVRLFTPAWEDDQTAVCRYEITGLRHPGPGHARGVDTAQALVLALHRIAVVLENSAEARAGRLRWQGEGSFGFRIPDDAAAAGEESAQKAGGKDEAAAAGAGSLAVRIDSDTLQAWARLPRDDLAALYSPETARAVERLADDLLDAAIFRSVTRDTFVTVVRVLAATYAEAARRLTRTIPEAGDHKDAGRVEEFRRILLEFAARSPTRFHREVAENYAAGRLRGEGSRQT